MFGHTALRMVMLILEKRDAQAENFESWRSQELSNWAMKKPWFCGESHQKDSYKTNKYNGMS